MSQGGAKATNRAWNASDRPSIRHGPNGRLRSRLCFARCEGVRFACRKAVREQRTEPGTPVTGQASLTSISPILLSTACTPPRRRSAQAPVLRRTSSPSPATVYDSTGTLTGQSTAPRTSGEHLWWRPTLVALGLKDTYSDTTLPHSALSSANSFSNRYSSTRPTVDGLYMPCMCDRLTFTSSWNPMLRPRRP